MDRERKAELERLAAQILLRNDMYKIPVDLLQIAKNYGIQVYDVDFDKMGKKDISGAIRYIDDKFSILLNANENENRRRFTLAHELGHFFLDYDTLKSSQIHVDTLYRIATMDKQKRKNYKSNINLTNESEIDFFAGSLLMNAIILKKIVEVNSSIKELANIFKVSESAMTDRLIVLGLL